MSTSRVKRSGTRRRVTNATLKPFVGNGNSDVKQSKVTQYFSTVQRGSTTSVKRLKLEAPTTEQESVFSSIVPEQAIKSEKFDEVTTILSDHKTEDDLEKSICAEKSTEQDSSATPQSVVTAKCLPTISPRVRKTVEPSSTVHTTATPRNRASRLLVFDSPEEVGNTLEDGKEGEATNSQQQLSSTKLFQGDDVAVKAKELAGIVKNNSKFREALKGGLQGKTSEEVRDRLKKLVASKDALQSVKQKLSAERLSASKVVYKSPIKIAPSQKPSTSAVGTSSSKTVVVPDFVLPLQKPKTPSKFGTPNKLLRTPVKDVYDNDDDSEEALRSPLKHGRAALLVSEVKNCATLPLPVKYERLYKLFGHMERVVSILYRQDRRITFDEVSRNVQKNIKCDFTRHHFAQIMSVYPKAFHVRLEEHWAPIGGTRGHDTRYDYVIEPNFKDDIIGFMREDEQLTVAEARIAQSEQPRFPLSPFKSPRGIRWGLSPLKRTPTKIMQPSSTTSDAVDKKPKMEVWRTTVRSYIFKYHLQQLVRTHHKSFLDKIGVKLKDEEMDSLRRYHPDFKLDEVDDIPEAELPEPPKGDEAELKTMRDYMRTVEDSSGSLPKRIQEMIDELRSPEKRAALVAGAKLEIPSSSSQNVPTEQKPKKMSLLERIRAKEQAKKCAQMMLDPEKEIRKDRLERLTRSTLRNICRQSFSYFIYYAFKKASTMEMSEMVSKLLFSANNCARPEMEAQIELLCEVAADYFQLKCVRGLRYLHMQRNDFDAVKAIITKQINDLK